MAKGAGARRGAAGAAAGRAGADVGGGVGLGSGRGRGIIRWGAGSVASTPLYDPATTGEAAAVSALVELE